METTTTNETTRFEEYGKLKVGDRIYVKSRPFKVSTVTSCRHYSRDFLEDCDDYGKEPGWYTEGTAVPDALTTEEQGVLSREAQERTARKAKAQAEHDAYKAKLAEIDALETALTAEYGLVEFGNSLAWPKGGDLTTTEVAAHQPGRGISESTLLRIVRDAGGVVVLLTCGGATFSDPAKRINPRFFPEEIKACRVTGTCWSRGKSARYYQGPGVPEADLSDDERAEVAAIREAQRLAVREEAVRDLTNQVRAEISGEVGHQAYLKFTFTLEFGPEFEEVIDTIVRRGGRNDGYGADRSVVPYAGVTARVVMPTELAKAPTWALSEKFRTLHKGVPPASILLGTDGKYGTVPVIYEAAKS